jgi:CheY-like chemotaxis protein
MTVAAETPPFDGAPAGDYVRLLVADTGTGMSDEVRQRAVDPFFTTKPAGQGTGLGLSMIFGYIKQSKGYLHIASELGRGTAITILMPRYDGAAAVEKVSEAQPAPVAAPATPPARVPTVLIVEDEALVRMLAVETIRDEGLTVLEEGAGESALALLDTDIEIDLLITDVKLPGRTGYELAAAGIARRPDLKVLLMTGFSKDPVPEALADAGVKVLYKPYDLEDLAANAQRMLKEAESAAEAKSKA